MRVLIKIILEIKLLQGNRMSHLLETPQKKNYEDKEIPQTGIKEEQIEYSSEVKDKESEETVESVKETLGRIEADIKNIEDRMKEIEGEKRNVGKDNDEVRVLKKEIIDLDFQHRITYNKLKKLEKEAEQAQKQQQEAEKAEREKERGGEKKYIGSYQLELAQLRHKARVRELQLELASQSLRRSRRIQAQADLLAIRSLEPYYWWRYYDYPLYRDPLYYSRYVDALYYDPIYYPSYRYSLYSDLLYPRYSYLLYI